MCVYIYNICILYIYAIGRNMSTQLALNTERINFALLLYILLRLFTTVLEKLYILQKIDRITIIFATAIIDISKLLARTRIIYERLYIYFRLNLDFFSFFFPRIYFLTFSCTRSHTHTHTHTLSCTHARTPVTSRRFVLVRICDPFIVTSVVEHQKKLGVDRF